MSQPPSTSRHPGRATLAELSGTDDFADRHIGPDHDEQAQMLAVLGLASLDELVAAAVPAVDPDGRPARPARTVGPRPRCWPSCAPWPAATGCSRR